MQQPLSQLNFIVVCVILDKNMLYIYEDYSFLYAFLNPYYLQESGCTYPDVMPDSRAFASMIVLALGLQTARGQGNAHAPDPSTEACTEARAAVASAESAIAVLKGCKMRPVGQGQQGKVR